MDMRTVGQSVGFIDVATVNVFSSVNEMILTQLREYFQQLFWMADSCVGVRFTQLWCIAILRAQTFHKVV